MIYSIMIAISIALSCGIKNREKVFTINGLKIIVNQKELKNLALIVLSGFPLFLISAFRYGIGTDYFRTYVPIFNNIAHGREVDCEIGFYLINRIIAFFSLDSQWLFAATSFMFVAAIFWSLYRYAENIPVSILLLFLSYTYFVSFNNIRQSIASAFSLVALIFLISGKKKLCYLFIAFAVSIHWSALAMLCYLIVDVVDWSALVYVISSCICFLFSGIIAPLLLNILANRIPRFARYLTQANLTIYRGRTGSRAVTLINITFILLMLVIERMREHQKINSPSKIVETREWSIMKLTQFLILAVSAFDGIIPAAYRIIRVFTFFQFILLPNMIEKNIKNKWIKRMLYIYIIIGYFYVFFRAYLNGSEEVYPYVSIFNR